MNQKMAHLKYRKFRDNSSSFSKPSELSLNTKRYLETFPIDPQMCWELGYSVAQERQKFVYKVFNETLKIAFLGNSLYRNFKAENRKIYGKWIFFSTSEQN